jgi:transcriptional regulator with XRE-family HTH domain
MVERIRTLLDSRQLTPTQFADLIGVARPIVSHILSGRNKPSLEVVQRILAAMPELAMPWLLNGSGPMLAAPQASGAVVASDAAIPPVLASPVAPTQPTVPAPAQEARPLAYQQNEGKPKEPASLARGKAATDPGTAQIAAPIAKVNKPTPFRPAAKPKRFVAQAPAAKSSSSTTTAASEVGVTIPNPAIAPVLQPEVERAAVVAEEPIAPTAEQPAGPATPASAMADALFAGAEKPIRRIVIFYRDGSFADYQPE